MIKTCSDERMTYMKKLVMLVTVVLTVAMAAVCFAAGDGNDLKAFAALQKQVKDTLGTMKEMKFVAYERFDQGDRLTYLGSYSKQQLVRVIYGFNKEGKLTEFIFAPVEVQKQEQK
mgnify:CR=1 FL=1